MIKLFLEKLKESVMAVLPITVLVLILSCFFPIPFPTILAFIIGAVLLIVGLSFFNLGAESSMMKMGEDIGTYVTKKKNLGLLVIIISIIGFIITVAEPDLMVLAKQLNATIPMVVLIIFVAFGVGTFLALALVRIVLQVNLNLVLFIMYFILFIIATFVPDEFIALAFDSGGVTTGPMTVPFILALGKGVANARGSKNSKNDSFGLVSFCSVGPILMVLILGIFFRNPSVDTETVSTYTSVSEFFGEFGHTFFDMILEIGIAILPILICVFVFKLILTKDSKKNIIKILIGLGFTFVGLVIFLTGANIGFMPLANVLGSIIGSRSIRWILIPLGMIMGFFVVMAEPAVAVLNKQVEEITSGAISKKVMMLAMAIGVAVSVGLSMSRVIFDYSIWYILVPGYLIAILLMLFVPKIFTAIAFDSGGVASGPMTATFLLPLAVGACTALYSTDPNYTTKMLTNGFGVVALVAMTPLIVVQIVGLMFKIKTKIQSTNIVREKEEIIEFIIDYSELEEKSYE